MSDAERTDDDLYDTVLATAAATGFMSGLPRRWCGKKSLCGRRSATQRSTLAACGSLYNIAAYPHLKGDDLAEQARLCQTAPMKRPLSVCRARCGDGVYRTRRCAHHRLFAYAESDGPFPTVLMCGGLDAMQTDITACMNVILRRAALLC